MTHGKDKDRIFQGIKPVEEGTGGAIDFNSMIADKTVFAEAEFIVGGARHEQYGQAERNFGMIAEQWSLYIQQKHNIIVTLTPHDIGWMMADLKKVRQMKQKKRDNIVDAIGYIGLLDSI